jgi:pyruvate/2-oxoacid:ferredoxin oxidoreductase alpha subunit
VEAVRRALGKAKKVVVIDRNFSFGASGIFAQEVRAAICNVPGHPPIFGYIAGLGGRDITVQLLEEIYFDVKGSDTPRKESIWVGLQEVNRAT